MSIIKLLMFVICFVFLIEVIKNFKSEFVIPISVCAGVLLFSTILTQTESLFEKIRELSERLGVDILYIEILFKIIGISYLCEFVSSLCKDVGQTAFSVKVDLAGKLMILSSSLPIFGELIEIIFKILP